MKEILAIFALFLFAMSGRGMVAALMEPSTMAHADVYRNTKRIDKLIVEKRNRKRQADLNKNLSDKFFSNFATAYHEEVEKAAEEARAESKDYSEKLVADPFNEVKIEFAGNLLHYKISIRSLRVLTSPPNCVVLNSRDKHIKDGIFANSPDLTQYFLICPGLGYEKIDLMSPTEELKSALIKLSSAKKSGPKMGDEASEKSPFEIEREEFLEYGFDRASTVDLTFKLDE